MRTLRPPTSRAWVQVRHLQKGEAAADPANEDEMLVIQYLVDHAVVALAQAVDARSLIGRCLHLRHL